jgi:hypothetical protein
MRWSGTLSGLSARDRRRRVLHTLSQINSLSSQYSPGTNISESSIPGLLSPEQRVIVWAALAVADASPMCLVSPAEPLSDADNRELWWRALNTLATPEQTVALCSLPPARALASLSTPTTITDVSLVHTAVVTS